MRNIRGANNPYGDDKVIDSCSLFGMMNTKGKRFPSKDPVRAMSNMRERGRIDNIEKLSKEQLKELKRLQAESERTKRFVLLGRRR